MSSLGDILEYIKGCVTACIAFYNIHRTNSQDTASVHILALNEVRHDELRPVYTVRFFLGQTHEAKIMHLSC